MTSPSQKYFEMDFAFLGLRVPKVGFLAVKDPSDLLQNKKKNWTAWNHQMEPDKVVIPGTHKKYPVEVFNSFQGPQNVDSLLFSQLCVYYYTDIRPAVVNEVIEGDCVYIEAIATNLDGEIVYKK